MILSNKRVEKVMEEQNNSSKSVQEKMNEIKKKGRKGKKKLSDDSLIQPQPVTNVELETTNTTDSNTPIVNTEASNHSAPNKLKEKIKTLRSKRTGVERRQQVDLQKKNEQLQGKKSKNLVKSMARETIHELLTKFGVQDVNLEDDVMRNIASGTIRSPQDVASFLVRRLDTMFPKGPGSINSTQIPSQPSQSSTRSTPSYDTSISETPEVKQSMPSVIQSTPDVITKETSHRKQLHHPRAELIK